MKTSHRHINLFCKTLMILLLCFCAFSSAYTQKVETYKVWITLLDKTKVEGILYAANEHELVILNAQLEQRIFSAENIEVIKIRREGKRGKGAWIGAATGFIINAAIILADGFYDGIEAEGILIGGVTTGALGGFIGMGIASGKKKFVVNGSKTTYLKHLAQLQRFAPHTRADKSIVRGAESAL